MVPGRARHGAPLELAGTSLSSRRVQLALSPCAVLYSRSHAFEVQAAGDITVAPTRTQTAHQEGGSIPVLANSILSEKSLHGEFGSAVATYGASNGATTALSLLSRGDSQTEAVFDAWALGRHDARYLLLLRRLILELQPHATRRAIAALAHIGVHPDIFWTKDNWIGKEIRELVRPSFRWTPEEIAHMIRTIDNSEWGRGTLGQSFDVLMYEDPNAVAKLRSSVGLMLGAGDFVAGVRAAMLALSHSRDARQELSLLIEGQPTLLDNEWFREIAATVREFGDFSLY